MQTLGNAARGAHENSLQASRMIYDTRCALARLFGFSHPERVIFTANATESLNLALNGLFSPGDHVITTDLEHNSVLRPLYRLEDQGTITLDFVPADRMGNPDYSAFEDLIRPNTRAIVTTHASNLTGNLVDLPRVSAIAKSHGLLLVVDASQTAGSIPISMEDLGIDLLCFTGHKGLMGPQGTGGLCVSPGVTLRPWKVGGSGVHSYSRTQPEDYPTCLEAGTLNGHGIAGLSAAVDFLLETGVDAIARRERELTFRFYRGVKDIPRGHRVRRLLPAPAGRHCGIESGGRGLGASGRRPDGGLWHCRPLRRPLRPPDASGSGHPEPGSRPVQLFLVHHRSGN